MSGIHHRIRSVTAFSRAILTVVSLGVAVLACARSPQVVVLSPELAGPPGRIEQQRTIELRVRDARSSRVVGSRGGLYAETSNITTEDDIGPGLAKVIGEQLEKQGYVVVPPGSGGDVVVTVALEELKYTTGGSVLTEIKLSSTVGVTSTKGGETMTSRYRTNHKEEFATAPDAEENSELVNMVVGKSLDAMLADQEFRDFLSR